MNKHSSTNKSNSQVLQMALEGRINSEEFLKQFHAETRGLNPISIILEDLYYSRPLCFFRRYFSKGRNLQYHV